MLPVFHTEKRLDRAFRTSEKVRNQEESLAKTDERNLSGFEKQSVNS